MESLRDGWKPSRVKHALVLVSTHAKWFETSVRITDEKLAMSHVEAGNSVAERLGSLFVRDLDVDEGVEQVVVLTGSEQELDRQPPRSGLADFAKPVSFPRKC